MCAFMAQNLTAELTKARDCTTFSMPFGSCAYETVACVLHGLRV